MRDFYFIDENWKMSEKRNCFYFEEGKLFSNLIYDMGIDIFRY